MMFNMFCKMFREIMIMFHLKKVLSAFMCNECKNSFFLTLVKKP